MGKGKSSKGNAIIIGAGPAGLTAAYELLSRTGVIPILYEMAGEIGGISKTLNYKGNRIDIGGHRFFSKSDQVMRWWLEKLPLQGAPARDDLLLNRKVYLSSLSDAPDPEKADDVFLARNRISRIFFLRKFFDYPISLSLTTFGNLGLTRVFKIVSSYAKARLDPIRPEKSMEDFFVNRFGRELYFLFFKDYTEKVWGVGCDRIQPEWGAQRVKGLSISKSIFHAINSLVNKKEDIHQKNTETSLIEQFLYPKHGPGQMWEKVAADIIKMGGEIHLNHRVAGLSLEGAMITSVSIQGPNDTTVEKEADYFFSTMPVRDLVGSMKGNVPEAILQIAAGLAYRDFITVGLLLKRLKIKNNSRIKTLNGIVPDNWIYIQERDVRLGRLQIFNNWSPYMVKEEGTVWIGLEYFCNEGDALWNMSDMDFAEFAIDELAKIDIIETQDVLDHVVIRMPKTYPAYFGTYGQFDQIRTFTDQIKNLFLIGRNGMHRYNNMDHSMLTAMQAVDNIIKGVESKDAIWAVNAEEDYHERR